VDVPTADISGIIALVREVCDRWDNPRAWREHLLQGVCELLEGHIGSMHTVRILDGCYDVQTVAVVGLPPGLAAKVQASNQELVTGRDVGELLNRVMPTARKLFDEYFTNGWATASCSELTDEATYHSSPMYLQFRKPLDCDDHVVSIRSVDIPQRAEIIDVDRPHGAPPFGPHDVNLLRLLHNEIAPLVGVRLATESDLSRDRLSRRLNETLTQLLDGRSEKEVAAELGLSSRTVHDYVSTLYRHFGVNSRAELMAYFIRRQPAPRGADAEANRRDD
jgi:DNA-binding CsgD family transcriptional regulator